MHDVRGIVTRAMDAYDNGKSLQANVFEGTTLGVSEDTFAVAMTYPRCLRITHFGRFIFAPTCCYQMVFPLEEKRSMIYIGKRSAQVLLSAIVMSYIFYQHIIPVCEQSVVHFDN